MVEFAGGTISEEIDGFSLTDVLLNGASSSEREYALIFSAKGFPQRAIRTRDFKLIWNPEPDGVYNGPTVRKRKGKQYGLVWGEWEEIAKEDPLAQAKIDRLLHHPEFELYDLRKDPYKVDNLALNPEYAPRVKELFFALKNELVNLGDELVGH